MTRTSDLRNLILKAKHAYYYSNEPILSDAEYDALEDELRQIAPDDPVLTLVGAPVPGDTMLTKARHSIPMGSQNKVKSEAEFMTWAARWPGSAIHASLKGDGASAAAYYEDGRLVQAISRGDGVIGEDITANALRFKGLPAWAGDGSGGFTGAVRFEVILTVEDWGRIDPARSKNPRNAGTGIMGRKNGHQSDCLTIFAFDLDETRNGQSVAFSTESAKLGRLAELGFNVISHQHCATPDEAIAHFRRIAAERDSLPFWIDGVVMKFDDLAAQIELGVSSGRPKGQVAWKFDSVGMETVLEGVVVSGGHTGALNPTAQLRPVEIGGTTVSNASLANYDEIARLDVAIGDSVWVVKANDIIPKIIRVTQRPTGRSPILPPETCPFCGGEVGRRATHDGSDGVIVECRNQGCPKKSSGKIKRWIASLDILGIGDSVLEAMLNAFELEDAADLYILRERQAELAELIINTEKCISLGEKRAASILDGIDATRNLTLSQFLGSLGLDHLGKRRVHLMMQAASGQLDTLEDWRCGKLRNLTIAEAAGVPNIGGQIQDGIDSMASVIDKLLAAGVTVLSPENDIPSSDEPPMKTVCISGKLPSGKKKSDYAEPLRAIGYELVDDVSKDLDYLVLAAPDSTSSKAEKARKLNIPVISEEGLEKMIANRPSAQPPSLLAPLTIAKDQNIPGEYICSPFDRNSPWNIYDLDEDDRSEILDALLENPATPDSFLISHANDANWDRIAARCGPNALRSETFRYGWWLHEVRGGENLAKGALRNPRCPSDILEKIFASAFDDWQLDPEDIRLELAMMASHANATSDFLQRLYELDIPEVVEQLANNVNCDPELRSRVSAKLNKANTEAKTAKTPAKEKKESKPKPAAKPPGSPNNSEIRRFEFNDGKSSKFWSIRMSGMDVEVRYGRIGTEGQVQTKTFDSPEAVQKHVAKLIAEKTGKGYCERNTTK